jgi:hypothetical protein
MANTLTLIILLPQSKKLLYNIDQNRDTIGDIYRFVRDSEKIPIKFLYAPILNSLLKTDKISTHFRDRDLIDFQYKNDTISPFCETDPLYIVVEFRNKFMIKIDKSPRDKIGSIISDVMDLLDQSKRTNLTANDVELVYNDTVLHPSDELALYSNISRSYIFYSPINEMNSGIISKILSAEAYYVCQVVGEKPKETPLLTLRLKTEELNHKDHNCEICSKDAYYSYPITLPMCRHIYCKDCIDEYVKLGHQDCYVCHTQF